MSLLGGGKVILSRKQETFCRLLAWAAHVLQREGHQECDSLWPHSNLDILVWGFFGRDRR